MAENVYLINIWINDERYEKLQSAGIANIAQDVLAGLKVVKVPATEAEKDHILKAFPSAKCDTATTGTIEMLPQQVKDQLFGLLVTHGNKNVIGVFLRSLNNPP